MNNLCQTILMGLGALALSTGLLAEPDSKRKRQGLKRTLFNHTPSPKYPLYLKKGAPFRLQEAGRAKMPLEPLPPPPVYHWSQPTVPRITDQAAQPVRQGPIPAPFRVQSTTIFAPGIVSPILPATPGVIATNQAVFPGGSALPGLGQSPTFYKFFQIGTGTNAINAVLDLNARSYYQAPPVGSSAIYQRK